jgi:hypothetical protein
MFCDNQSPKKLCIDKNYEKIILKKFFQYSPKGHIHNN